MMMALIADAVAMPPESMSGALERLGVASILVIASYYLLKYFIAQLDKKDLRLNDITDKFVEATRLQTKAIENFIAEQQRTQASMMMAQATMTSAIDKLSIAVDHMQERRLSQRHSE